MITTNCASKSKVVIDLGIHGEAVRVQLFLNDSHKGDTLSSWWVDQQGFFCGYTDIDVTTICDDSKKYRPSMIRG